MEVSFKAKPISIKTAENINQQLKKSKFFDIICHSSTDEDVAACAKALQWHLKTLKIPSQIISDSAVDTFHYTKQQSSLKKDPQGILCLDFSSYSRINKSLAEYINKAKNLICIDHHKDGNLKTNTEYIDTSAKSCSGIILRFFDALKKKIPDNILQQLYCGMLDDLRKNNYIRYNETLNPILTNIARNDKNTMQLYERLNNTLSQEERDEVVKHLNVLARLNKAEKKFKDDLESKIQFIPNKKFAFIEIPVKDEEWSSLGGDNKVTSAVMGNFRVSVLENPKFQELNTIAIFYPVNDCYRISIHSKNNSVIDFFNYVKNNTNPDLTAGGHPNRGGGCIQTLNPKKCHIWVEQFIKSAKEFYK